MLRKDENKEEDSKDKALAKSNEDLNKQYSFLHQIPAELIPNIFWNLSQIELFKSARTCRLFYQASKNRNVLKMVGEVDYSQSIAQYKESLFGDSKDNPTYANAPYFIEPLDDGRIIVAGEGKLFIRQFGVNTSLCSTNFNIIGLALIKPCLFFKTLTIVVGTCHGDIYFFSENKHGQFVPSFIHTVGFPIQAMAVSKSGRIVTASNRQDPKKNRIQIWYFDPACLQYACKQELDHPFNNKSHPEYLHNKIYSLGCSIHLVIEDHLLVVGAEDKLLFFANKNNSYQFVGNENIKVAQIVIEGRIIFVSGITHSCAFSSCLLVFKQDNQSGEIEMQSNYYFGDELKSSWIIGMTTLPNKKLAISVKSRGIFVADQNELINAVNIQLDEKFISTQCDSYQLKVDGNEDLLYFAARERAIVRQTFMRVPICAKDSGMIQVEQARMKV